MRITVFILCFVISSFTFAQQTKKSVNAIRAPKSPSIDGILDEPFWQDADIAKDFVMFQPGEGDKEPENRRTEVKIAYDNEAIYFGAILYDPEPDKIPMQFGGRDEIRNVDFFLISLNPFNDYQNDYEFVVMSTNAQADAKVFPSGREDFGWNAVWDSEVKVNNDNWVVEIKIPYSELRFANLPIQTWGVNFHRKMSNLNEQYVWNYINKSKGEISQYAGTITNLENISPPIRLSFYPYASGTFSAYEDETQFDESFGLDIKYGLNESYTLDVTLIPDFGQTAFDNTVLNLGPFEQHYSEKRPFFNEGTELFGKGDLFYSRRIGNEPIGYYDVEENLKENEEIIENPSNVNMINAIKLSGRNKNGFGVGVFNAITEKTYAIIKDTITGDVHKEMTEPLANYNVLVVDQQFNKNSSIGLVNTNVLRSGSFRDANATALIFDISDKKNKYNTSGNLKMSTYNEDGENTTGFAGSLSLSKIYGNFHYGISHWRSDENFSIQDLGFQRRNNYANYNAYVSYRIFEPTKTFNQYRISFEASLEYLNSPNTYTGNELELNSFFVTTNRFAFGSNIDINIGDQYDYYEPRVDGRYIKQNGVFGSNFWISSDYRKKFAIDSNLNYAFRYNTSNTYFEIGIAPRYRFSDKFQMHYEIEFSKLQNEKGYVEELENGDIIFGNRDVKNIINSISSQLNFNTKSQLSLAFRHYWSPVQYDAFYVLNEDGSLQDTFYSENNDINYNIWNLDLNYTWQFAPGSFLVALYRNSIFNEDDMSYLNFKENLNNLFNEPMSNIISLKVIYYLDYNQLKTWL